jgi:hypothetical protein
VTDFVHLYGVNGRRKRHALILNGIRPPRRAIPHLVRAEVQRQRFNDPNDQDVSSTASDAAED